MRRVRLGLAALLAALSPVLLLVLYPQPHGPQPAIAPGPLIRAAPMPHPVTDIVEAEEPASGDNPTPAAPRPDDTPCRREAVHVDALHRCLFETIRTSEQALEAAVANALRVIAARTDLLPAQRGRWASLLDEAQSRFLLYRNFDCQSVAPFEGRRGIGNFEERARCLIAANTRRIGELAARYAMPAPGEAASAAEAGPQDRPAGWTHPTFPPLE